MRIIKKIKTPIVKKPLMAWILSGDEKLKLVLMLTVQASVFVRVLPLEMQKQIINEAIKLRAFDLLLMYCGFYLAAVVIAGGLKFVIGFLQTIIGQSIRPLGNAKRPLPPCADAAVGLF